MEPHASTKACTGCGVVRSLADFCPDRRNKDGRQSRCKLCDKQYRESRKDHIKDRMARYRRDNAEKVYAAQKRWRSAHRDEVAAADRAHFLATKSRHQELNRLRYARRTEEQKEHAREYGRQWANRNRDKVRATIARYKSRHPDKVREWTARRRAMLRGAPVADFTYDQWLTIKAIYGNRCAYCGKKTRKLTQDHVIPVSRGGFHTASNIVPACQSCNSRKHDNEAPTYQPHLFAPAEPWTGA